MTTTDCRATKRSNVFDNCKIFLRKGYMVMLLTEKQMTLDYLSFYIANGMECIVYLPPVDYKSGHHQWCHVQQ